MKLFLREVAKWRKTGFSTYVNSADIKSLIDKYGLQNLYVHFDSGVPNTPVTYEPDEESDDEDAVKSVQDPKKASRNFQEVPQKTFNINTVYSTPIGIYLYPLSYIVKSFGIEVFDEGGINEQIPFAADKKFIYVYLIPDEKVVKINDLIANGAAEKLIYEIHKNEGTDGLREKLEETGLFENSESFILAYYKTRRMNSDRIANPELKKAGRAEQAFEQVMEWDRNDEYGETIISGELYSGAQEAQFDLDKENLTGRLWFYLLNNIQGSNVKLTKYFLKLGIKVLSDSDGWGVIHGNEPTQTILFDPSVSKIVYVKNNIGSEQATQKAARSAQAIAKSGEKFNLQSFKKTLLGKGATVAIENASKNTNLPIEAIEVLFQTLKDLSIGGYRERAKYNIDGNSVDIALHYLLKLPKAPIQKYSSELLQKVKERLEGKLPEQEWDNFWRGFTNQLIDANKGNDKFYYDLYQLVKTIKGADKFTAPGIIQSLGRYDSVPKELRDKIKKENKGIVFESINYKLVLRETN